MYAGRFLGLFCFLIFQFNSWCQNADSIAIADELYEQGKELYYDGAYRPANKFFQQALDGYRRQVGEQHPKVVKTYGRLGDVARRLRLHPQALEYYGKGLDLAQQLDNSDPEYLADFKIDIGHVYSQMYRPKKANRIYFESLKVYQQKYGETSSKVGNAYMSIGISWIKMGQYRDAKRYFQKAFDIFQKTSEPNSVDFNRIYSNMGYLFRKSGAFEQAVDYGEKALEIKLMNYKADHPSVPKYYRNIGRALQEWGKYEEALPYFRKTSELTRLAYGASHSNTAGSYGELGNILADLGRLDEALTQYSKSIAILEKTIEPTHPYLVGGYFNIGRVYQEQGKYEEALAYYEDVLEKFNQSKSSVPRQIAEAQGQIATVLLQLGKADLALQRSNLAIQSLVSASEYKQGSEYDNPSLDMVQAELEFLRLLSTKSRCLEARAEQNSMKADLEAALATSTLAIELVQNIQQSFASESSRQWINEEADQIFTMAVNQAFQLYERTGQISFAEKAYEIAAFSKASLLWQHLTEAQARQIARLPDEAAQQLQQLETDMQFARENWMESPSEESRRQFRESRLNYIAADEQLEAKYPDYSRLKSAGRTASLNDLNLHLQQEESALLEYFYSEEHLYVFLLTPKGLQARKVSIDPQFEEDILGLRSDRLSSLLGNKSTIQKFQSSLFRLHELLIAPIQNSIDLKLDRLIVIPHKKLHLLAFEMLAPQTSEKDFKKLDYLLRNYSIQYSWSAGLLLQHQRDKAHPKHAISFLGMAPNFTELADAGQVNYRQSLTPLKFNQLEVERASRRLGGKALIGVAASESAFVNLANQSKLLHLATHGIVDDRNPLQSGLFFSAQSDSLEDGFLSALEIYGMNLPTDMAILSACNTGYGQLASGEGVMSLGRAFTYAGCQSVLVSLWLANDQSTAQIMNQLYENLQNGKGKQEALRQAKLDYLASADPVGAHPYFWAGIIATGDMQPIQESGFRWMSWQLWGIAALLIWWFFSRIKWRKKKKSNE